MRVRLALIIMLVAASDTGAATFQEEFASDPQTRGWHSFGVPSLFYWNSTNQNLEVTWNTERPNSFFCRPLGTVLTKSDDFSLAFDLRLDSIALDFNSPYAFEVAIGLLNLASATNANFIRGTGTQSPNLVEFDYFPDTGFGATVSPAMVSSNNQFATSFTFPLELTSGDLFRIAMNYSASNQTLTTTITRNGQPFGPIKDVKPGTTFTDFRVDTFSVSSYSDNTASGSIIVRGVLDNIVITTPEPPVTDLVGSFTNSLWQVQFTSRPNWVYTLERSSDLRTWVTITPAPISVETKLVLQDSNAPPDKAFYRVRAERP